MRGRETAKERALDAWLVAATQTGDRRALSRLAERWHPKMLGHARRLTGDDDFAAEAAQESWVEILRGIHGLDDTAAFPAWAFRIVTRRIAKGIRGCQRRRAGDAALAADPPPPAPGGEAIEARADMAAVRKAIATLPAGQQAALALFYLEDMRVADIAVALDIPPGTVKTRLMHARNALRASLEGERQ